MCDIHSAIVSCCELPVCMLCAAVSILCAAVSCLLLLCAVWAQHAKLHQLPSGCCFHYHSVLCHQRARGHTGQRRPLGTPTPAASGLLFALPQCTELLSDPLVELNPGPGRLHRARGPGAARRCRPARSPRASA